MTEGACCPPGEFEFVFLRRRLLPQLPPGPLPGRWEAENWDQNKFEPQLWPREMLIGGGPPKSNLSSRNTLCQDHLLWRNIHLSCRVAGVWQKTRRLWVGTQARSKWHINVGNSIIGRGRWDPQLADERLKGLSRVLIFWRTTVPSDGNNFWTRYFTSSTDRTVSPTLMGATKPQEVTTGRAGDGTDERPRNWNKDLKIGKTQVWQTKDFIRGYVGRED